VARLSYPVQNHLCPSPIIAEGTGEIIDLPAVFINQKANYPSHPPGNDTQFQCSLICFVVVCHERVISMFGYGNAITLAQIKERG